MLLRYVASFDGLTLRRLPKDIVIRPDDILPRRKCANNGKIKTHMCVSANHIVSHYGNDCDVLPLELLVSSNFPLGFSPPIRYNSSRQFMQTYRVYPAYTYVHTYVCAYFILFYLIFCFFQYLLSLARALVCEWSELCVIYSWQSDSIDPFFKLLNTLFNWVFKNSKIR